MLELAAVTTGNKIGLAVMAAVFIGFALGSSFLAPRRWPGFPGRAGLSAYIIVSLALFAAMIAAIAIFGRESEPKKGAEPAPAVVQSASAAPAGGQALARPSGG